MEDIGTILGWISFGLLALWRIYWYISGKKAEKEKPKATRRLHLISKRTLSQLVPLFAFGIVGVQLLGVPLFSMPFKSLPLQILGFLFVVAGLSIAIIGRRNLDTNWANCYEYQVKKNQELVTHGIYHYIRHPLYIGIVLFYIGGEFIAQSYLVYLFLFAFLAANQQAKWEEELLIKHFGEQYRTYIRRTKRFIPFLW